MIPNNAKKNRKDPSRYEEAETPTEFLFEVEKEYRQMFYQATD